VRIRSALPGTGTAAAAAYCLSASQLTRCADLLCCHPVKCRCGGCCNQCTLCQLQRHIKNNGGQDSGVEKMER
jgi:hypothetical protein